MGRFNYGCGGLTASVALRSKNGWNSNENGIDSYGFSALPAGVKDGAWRNFSYECEGEITTFWSANEFDLMEFDKVGAYVLYLDHNEGAGYWDDIEDKVSIGTNNKSAGYSIRCIHD